MKKMLLAVLLGAGLCGLYAAENPALELFGDDITFYVSFDEGNGTADLADGSEKPVPIGSVTYADGVFGGKAFQRDKTFFDFKIVHGRSPLCDNVDIPRFRC